MKRALITGIAGQDGGYLAELLLSKGYMVFGLLHGDREQTSTQIPAGVTPLIGDLLDESSIESAIRQSLPDEIYNLAAFSFIPASWTDPLGTAQVNAFGVVRLLESIRRLTPNSRFYQASSSEMFGYAPTSPQNEETAFLPYSPYGVAKTFGHQITVNYRIHYGLFGCCGILFNHESERRRLDFVTRHVTYHVARISLGFDEKLRIGNLNATRDWGYAPDYVEAMWLMLQQEQPDDYVIATGISRSVRELVQIAFDVVGLKWESHVVHDERMWRPAERVPLCGDASKARAKLGWSPRIRFEEMIERMVLSDRKLVAASVDDGHSARATR